MTIKVKVKPGADEGTDKLTFQVKGAAGKAAKSKILVRYIWAGRGSRLSPSKSQTRHSLGAKSLRCAHKTLHLIR